MLAQADLDCVAIEAEVIVAGASFAQDRFSLTQNFEAAPGIVRRQRNGAENHRSGKRDTGFFGYIPALFEQIERSLTVIGEQSNASDDVIEEGDETPRTDDLDCFKAFAGVLLSGGQFALVEKYPAACAAGDELAACLSYPCHQVDGGVAVVERFVKAQAVHMRDGAHRKIGDLGQRQFVCARQGDAMIEALVSLMNSS